MKFPSIFKNKEAKQQKWQWPSCNHPRTHSFRETESHCNNKNAIVKTVNSIFLDPVDALQTPESIFTNYSSSRRISMYSTDEHRRSNLENNKKMNNYCPEGESLDQSLEIIIRDVRSSERLFYEPNDTSSLLATKEDDRSFPFKESVALALESDEPYMEFKKSMQAMVEAHGIKDWECLEELLGWYLKMNGKTNHGIIVGAFVDVLIESIASSSSCNDSTATATVCCSDSSSYSSANSCFSSSSSPVSLSTMNCPRL